MDAKRRNGQASCFQLNLKNMNDRSRIILAIDVGNTSTSCGLYRAGEVLKTVRIQTSCHDLEKMNRALRRLVGSRTAIGGAALASVVPRASPKWRRLVTRLFPRTRLVEVRPKVTLGVGIDYPEPKTIGADRLANACGAVARYGAPVIVADFGTAVTFDVVSGRGDYTGGVIAPGIPLMFTYLADKTALLPRIGPGAITGRVGKSTVEAMRMGAMWGYRGLVREILVELKKGFRGKQPFLCATGGYASEVLKGSGIPITIDPDLTLFGLGQIYELNS
jgi:type III pantothenate kinase